MTFTRFAPGPGTAYITEGVLALSDAAGVDAELMQLCATVTDWCALADGARARQVTALVQHDTDRLRLAVADGASIVVETAAGAVTFDGTDPWATDTVERAQVVTLVSRAGPGGSADFRVDGGVVPAALVTRHLAPAAVTEHDPFELLFGATVDRSVEAAAVRSDADVAPVRAAVWVLVFHTGERVVVDRSVVLGRHPRRIDEAMDGPRARLVRLPYPGVSRRHAAIRLGRTTVSIEDLGSANGTTVSSPARPTTELRPGCPVDLAIGDVIDLGHGVSFVVEVTA